MWMFIIGRCIPSCSWFCVARAMSTRQRLLHITLQSGWSSRSKCWTWCVHSEFRWFLILSMHFRMLSRSSSINHNFSPVCFPLTWQDNAWLDNAVFLEWIKEVVVPYAKDGSRLDALNEDQPHSKNVNVHFGSTWCIQFFHDFRQWRSLLSKRCCSWITWEFRRIQKGLDCCTTLASMRVTVLGIKQKPGSPLTQAIWELASRALQRTSGKSGFKAKLCRRIAFYHSNYPMIHELWMVLRTSLQCRLLNQFDKSWCSVGSCHS